MSITPAQVVWHGPGEHRVVLDEDMVSLRPGRALEETELDALLAVIAEAKRCRDAGTAPTPARPDLPF